MKVVSLIEFLFCKIQPRITSQIDRLIVYFADISSLKIKLNCSLLNGYKTKNKLLYSPAEIRKLTTAADKNTYAGLVLSSFAQYRTRWFEKKTLKTLKASVHNGQGNGKKIVSLTSEHKIIISSACQASLANDITHQNTCFHWSLLNLQGTLHYTM